MVAVLWRQRPTWAGRKGRTTPCHYLPIISQPLGATNCQDLLKVTAITGNPLLGLIMTTFGRHLGHYHDCQLCRLPLHHSQPLPLTTVLPCLICLWPWPIRRLDRVMDWTRSWSDSFAHPICLTNLDHLVRLVFELFQLQFWPW